LKSPETRISDLSFRVREKPKCKRRADYPQIYFRPYFPEAAKDSAQALPKTFSRTEFLKTFRSKFLSIF
jgi:hypothetical protein